MEPTDQSTQLPNSLPNHPSSLPSEYYRAGVGALIVNEEGAVLVFERIDRPGAWQFPQGGIETGEALDRAVRREIEEETGIASERLTLMAKHPDPLAYELPAKLRSSKAGRGQVQHWFLFRLTNSNAEIPLPKDGEFRAWRWVQMTEFLPDVVAFRQRVYAQLAEHFASYLK